jgi:hypothetical protein
MAFAQQLTPEQIAELMRRAQQGVMNVGGDAGGYTTGPFDWRYDTYSDPNTYGVYDDQGNLQDTRSKESSSAQLGRFVAGAGAMYGLGSLLNGGMLGMGQGVTPMGDLGSMDALGTFTGADPATSAAWTNGAGLGKDTLSAIGATTSQTSPLMKTAASALSGLGSLGPVLGAVGGALTSKDQEQTANSTSTTTKDPYAPAKPFIDQQIAQGQSLANQYQANPFSAGQKQAYNNLTGLLGQINGGLGGLLGGMNAASSGANNFDRANPRKALTGSSFNLSGYAPGLLNLFGG